MAESKLICTVSQNKGIIYHFLEEIGLNLESFKNSVSGCPCLHVSLRTASTRTSRMNLLMVA